MCFFIIEHQSNYDSYMNIPVIKINGKCEWCGIKSNDDNLVYLIKHRSKYYNHKMCTLCINDRNRRIREANKRLKK